MTGGEPVLAAVLALCVCAALCAGAILITRARAIPVPRPLAAALEGAMSDVALRFTTDGRLTGVSASARSVLGRDPRELIGPGDPPEFAGLSALAIGETTVLSATRPDGGSLTLRAECHDPGDGDGRLVMLRDLTHLRQTEARLREALERLARLANEDTLTGLANRACLMDTAETLVDGAEAVAMIFIDLDRFRSINDVHGPGVGDLILRVTARRLARELGEAALIARLGADEYAVLLSARDGDAAIAARARDILRVLAEPIEIAPMTLDVSATLGIAISPRDGTTAAALLRSASVAMNQARLAGGGCYRFFEKRMTEELALAEELKADLRAAIAAGEIAPFFQPLIRLSDGATVGFEVLARWEHPERGLLPPMTFLPLVEEMGLSAAMFAAVLSRACAVARDWPMEIRLSVNVSATELQDESLPEDLRAILRETGMDGGRIEIEVTENALIHDSRIARGVVDRLRAMGISMAMDDFGTGFSSLYHLRELPFDKLKIDKSFMRALAHNADSARYVGAIIGLGQALGLEVTAEGVEDEATMTVLRDMGCTYGQGYWFGRPVPAAEAAKRLTASTSPVLAAE